MRATELLSNGNSKNPIKIVCYSRTVSELAKKTGWFVGASYLRLRDIRGIEPIGLIDIDWKNYDFKKHLEAVRTYRPMITVANDLVQATDLNRTIEQAYELLQWSNSVVIVPKDLRLGPELSYLIPKDFVLGYSIPTRYGGTLIPLEHFSGRPVHLLGGRPDMQRKVGNSLDVISLDVNRFTLDAKYGDFFDGKTFIPHPIGGYHRCLQDSILNIDALWRDYIYGHKRFQADRYKKGKNARPSANKKAGSTKL
jgi:hypothetical protein